MTNICRKCLYYFIMQNTLCSYETLKTLLKADESQLVESSSINCNISDISIWPCMYYLMIVAHRSVVVTTIIKI